MRFSVQLWLEAEVKGGSARAPISVSPQPVLLLPGCPELSLLFEHPGKLNSCSWQPSAVPLGGFSVSLFSLLHF